MSKGDSTARGTAIVGLLMVVGVVLYIAFKGRVFSPPSSVPTTALPSGIVSDAAIAAATHVVNLSAMTPLISTSGGTERVADASNSTIMNVPTNFTSIGNWNMSIADLRLNQGGVREPH
jgi:hypothetical protein